jgi:hypothetical protein
VKSPFCCEVLEGKTGNTLARDGAEFLSQLMFYSKPFAEEARPYILPGIGPHPEAPEAQQIKIDIPADKLYQVARKIVRGCEYWFGNGRIVDPPYEIDIYFAHQADIPDVVRVFSGFGPFQFGPGFRVRGATQEDPLSVIYEVIIWDSLTFYATILAPDPAVNQK